MVKTGLSVPFGRASKGKADVLTHSKALPLTCASALLWSSRVRQVMFSGGTPGAYSLRISALVLAGLATTSTLTSLEACLARAEA